MTKTHTLFILLAFLLASFLADSASGVPSTLSASEALSSAGMHSGESAGLYTGA